MASCSHCRTLLSGDAAFCPRCGTPVPSQPKTIICPHCNVQNPAGSTFCYSCSDPLRSNSANPPALTANSTSVTYTYIPGTLPASARVTGIIGMILGLVSCVSCYAGFGPGIAALILASISRRNTPPDVDNGKATVASTAGGIGIALSIISLIAYISML